MTPGKNEHSNGHSSQIPLSSLGEPRDWSHMGPAEHFAQFYESEAFLMEALYGYVRCGLTRGEAVIVVATPGHRERLDQLLTRESIDVTLASASGQFVLLDARETLSKFMNGSEPDGRRFSEVIGAVVKRAGDDRRPVRIFGEMVAILWNERNYSGAIALEALWNQLQKKHPFSLFCGYPVDGVAGDELAKVCSQHSQVIPAESYVSLRNPDDRMKAIIQLQQNAISLTAEIAERKRAEASLRDVKRELELQVEDLRHLHEISARLTTTLDMDSVLKEVLCAAMAVQGTNMGLLSLCDASQQYLTVAAQEGFGEEFLRRVETVPLGHGACGSCLEQRCRVIVEDTELDEVFESYRTAARGAGFRACHSTPLITRGGNIIGVLSVHFRSPHHPSDREMRLMDLFAHMAADIIENARLHKRVQEELNEREQLLLSEQQAREEAETANRMKDEFLATVSHELRTPLNAIIGWSHMLRGGRLDEVTIRRAVETIDRNAKAQAQLVEDILDVSRVITGKLHLKTGPVDLASVINSSIDSVQLAADSKHIQLAVTLEPSARHTIGDEGRLQQVVWNLLSNAIKFTPNGGHVDVRLERAGPNVRIEVRDTGQGICTEIRPFIFDRFRQADGTSTRRFGGLGLGLAIVRHLVELHGGIVEVESLGEGLGSTFTVVLPLIPTESTTLRKSSNDNHWPNFTPECESPAPVSLDGVQVLLVDDDSDTIQMLRMVLQEHHAVVESASSVQQALETLDWYRPHVLVSDLAMPEEDGYSLIAKVRAADAQKSTVTRAVALTSYVRVEDRTRALAAGFDMFVPKPVEPNELITVISNLVESSAVAV